MTTRPVWVVVLTHRQARKDNVDTKYVRAATIEGAVKTARFNSYLPKSAQAYARIATPHDLGCTPTGENK